LKDQRDLPAGDHPLGAEQGGALFECGDAGTAHNEGVHAVLPGQDIGLHPGEVAGRIREMKQQVAGVAMPRPRSTAP